MFLVVNAGSSSVKVAIFDSDLQQIVAGHVTEIGGTGQIKLGAGARKCTVPDHFVAMQMLFAEMELTGVAIKTAVAAGHRVVHGGASLIQSCLVTPEVEAEIEACVRIAPLHNPANLTGIRALRGLLPDLPQYACFDTAFHASNPPVATTYALPLAERELGLRRYGFHGISYAGLVEKVKERAAGDLPKRILAFHLGNGASACAILGGRSVASSMGYSPLEGLTMGTRTGSIDGNAVLRLVEIYGIEGAGRLLNRESGLLGLAGQSDMHALEMANTSDSRFAREHFAYWACRHGGSLISAMEGLDAVAFTGGIGENDVQMRRMIIEGLAWAGNVPVHVIPAEEERSIAAEVLAMTG